MTRSLSVLSKILGLTTSSNPNEARAAEEKLEQQLQARGITREQLENSLDMSTVDEEIEAISFRYGKPYKRIEPATATILSAVARFYNGSIVYAFHDRDYANDWSYKSTISRQFEVFCSKKSQIEIEIYTDYILQALDDKWTQHCKEDPFQVEMMGSAHRNNFRKGFAEDIKTRLWKMKREEEENGREIQTESRTINQSALAVQKKNSSEKGIIQAYKKEKYPKLYSSSGTSRGSGSGASAGRSAGSSVGLSRQVAGGGYKALGGY